LSYYIEKVEWVKDFLESQGRKTPARVYQDSLSGKDRKQHFKKRRLLVKDTVDDKVITIKYLPTEAIVADFLTKPLQGQLFTRLRMAITNCDDSLCGGVSENVNSDTADCINASNIIINDNNKSRKKQKQ
jgi:hypothetical protein